MIDHVIPYGHQHITQEDVDAVVAALKSDYMTQGPRIGEFEKAFANYLGCKYACMVSNGTAALHLCAMALDIKPGDKVITTPNMTRFSSSRLLLWLLPTVSVTKVRRLYSATLTPRLS